MKTRKLTTNYGAEDIYKEYLKSNSSNNKVSRKMYSAILKRFFEEIFNNLIFKGVEFSMPNRLGNLKVRKAKIKYKLDRKGNLDKTRLAPDWNACRKLWAKEYPDKAWKQIVAIKDKPIVYHMNRHTDGYRHSWHWDKSTCLAKNSSAYSLEINRTVDRKLARALKDENLVLDYSIY